MPSPIKCYREGQKEKRKDTNELNYKTKLTDLENKFVVADYTVEVRNRFKGLALIAEKAMAPYSSTLAWKIPWTEEPDGLQSMGSLRVGHD